MKNKTKNPHHACPCESGQSYQNCCQPYIDKIEDAPTAEKLMRSRYTAFTQLNEDYLRYSWHPETCPANLHLDNSTQWLGLRIKNTEQGGKKCEHGKVEFVARYKINDKAFRLHEVSQFLRYGNRWVYYDGKFVD